MDFKEQYMHGSVAANIHVYSYSILQLLSDSEFQQLRIKRACAHLQPTCTSRRGESRDEKLLLATEEERLVCTYVS